MGCSRATAWLVLALLPACLPQACTVERAMPHPRPAKPLPSALAARFAEPAHEELTVAPPRRVGDVLVHEGKLRVAGKELGVKLYVPSRRSGPVPFMGMLPVMAGGRILLDMTAMQLARHGIASGHVQRRGGVFRPQPVMRNGHELHVNGQQVREFETPEKMDADLRESIRHQRALLTWAAARPEIDGERLGCVGISMGAIGAGILAAVEPRLDAVAICLGGGGLPDLFVNTHLGRAQTWLAARARIEGADVRGYERGLARRMPTDPLRLARYVATEKVFLVQARFDTVIPYRNAELLWESLGRPARVVLPFEHYSAFLSFHWIMRKIARHSLRRFYRERE